jgi:hypothetical protein
VVPIALKVSAVNANGEGPDSEPTAPVVPVRTGAPPALNLLEAVAGYGSLYFRWEANAMNCIATLTPTQTVCALDQQYIVWPDEKQQSELWITGLPTGAHTTTIAQVTENYSQSGPEAYELVLTNQYSTNDITMPVIPEVLTVPASNRVSVSWDKCQSSLMMVSG